MSQRNRVAIAALGLSAALFLAVPSASGAAGFWRERIPRPGFVERFWSWMAELWPAGDSSGTTARWEKEGSAINPDGQPISATPQPLPPAPDDSE